MKPWELHPALVHFPIALLLSAVAVDLYAWLRRRDGYGGIVFGLLAGGVATGFAAALAGIFAYFTLPAHTSAAHEMMSRHIWLQASAMILFSVAVLIRWRAGSNTRQISARILGWFGAAILLWGSSVGGEMVYRGATGIDPALLAPSVQKHSHGEHVHEVEPKPATNSDDNGVRQP